MGRLLKITKEIPRTAREFTLIVLIRVHPLGFATNGPR
jgi:hypothetical protein